MKEAKSTTATPSSESPWDRVESAVTNLMPDLSLQHERREHFRHELKESAISVSFPTQNAFAKFYIRDVSSGGLYIKTTERPNLNTLIQVRLEIPGSETTPALESFLSARVVRHGANGIGLKVENSDPDSQRKLETLVKRVALDEGLLARPERRDGVFERISHRREIRDQRAKIFRKQSLAWLTVGALVALNLSVLTQQEMIPSTALIKTSSAATNPAVKIELSRDEERGSQKMNISIQRGLLEESVKPNDLPVPLRKTVEGAQHIAPEARKSKTAPTSRVRLR
jgi:hypothetical protein